MINRVLIRMKVMQMVYSFYQKEERSLATTEKELLFSLEKSYELYHLLLLLMIELTELHERRVDAGRQKHRPTDAERNPNLKLVENLFINQLKSNVQFREYCDSQKISWVNEPEFLRMMLDKILSSELYLTYIADHDKSFEKDRDFWRSAFKQIVLVDEELIETLEGMSLYWNDDIEVIGTFVLKSIKQFKAENGMYQDLLPMFKDMEDKEFAIELFRKSIMKEDDYRALIDQHTQNWEMERIAFMDIVIMQIAIAELFTFSSIPCNVTLNEYIELAKSYSTPKSGTFVNGVLNSLINQLKSENKLLKN